MPTETWCCSSTERIGCRDNINAERENVPRLEAEAIERRVEQLLDGSNACQFVYGETMPYRGNGFVRI
jgi:hypothetical protein